MEMISFHIDGEYITEQARKWFWDDEKPYEKSHELLENCLISDEITDREREIIIQDIMEGRKKLVGIDTLHLEDDNVDIRPLMLKLEVERVKNNRERITNLMESNFIKFVDPYSTVKSKEVATGNARNLRATAQYNVVNYKECEKYFLYPEWPDEDKYGMPIPYEEAYEPTKGGLWLMDYPEVAHEAVGSDMNILSDMNEFWFRVYKITKDWGDSSFQRRTKRYEACMRIDEHTDIDIESWQDLHHKRVQEKIKKSEEQQDGSEQKKAELTALRIQSENRDNLLYATTPDDIIKWEGLVAPNGDFYSCDFGGHNVKARFLILDNEETSKQFSELDKKAAKETRKLSLAYLFNDDRALDLLLENGWCATRYLPEKGNYIYTPEDVGSNKRVTTAQKNKIWDAIVKHEVQLSKSEQEKVL